MNLQDIKVTKVPFCLNGIQLNLCFTLNALSELEDKYGDVDKAMDMINKGSIKAVKTVLWAGLLINKKEDGSHYSEEDIGDALDIGALSQITTVIQAAMSTASPSDKLLKEAAKVNEQAAKANKDNPNVKTQG